MVSGVGPGDRMPAFLYLYIEDADTAYQHALVTTGREACLQKFYQSRRFLVRMMTMDG
jgi:hypothetical protein